MADGTGLFGEGWIITIILVADFLARLALAGRVVMRNAPVPTILAWLVLLLFVPLLGVPLYLLVGEVRLGSRRLKRYDQVIKIMEQRTGMFWREGELDWSAEVKPFRHVARLATEVADTPPIRGNRLMLLPDADGFFDAVAADIEAARLRCHLLMYIWAEVGSGERIGEALIRAAGRGVECRVLVDAVGSKRFLRSPLLARMRAAGVKIVAALPVSPLRMLFARVDLRNHRKIIVVDGRAGYVGSHNVMDPDYGLKPKIGPCIDATVRLEGPAVQALEALFLRDWRLEYDEDLGRLERYLPDVPVPDAGSIAQLVPTGPGPGRGIHETLLTTIFSAREELIITTPYFVPDESLTVALSAAAGHGVRVTLVLTARSDSPIVLAAGRGHYADLLEAGVRIFEYDAGLLHSKTMTVDSDIALIGSTNLDMRSFRLNFEATLFVYDEDFTSLVRMMQVDYLQNARELFADEWRKRPFPHRLAQNTARLLGPLL